MDENCHGNKKFYIANHKENVHGKQSLIIIISSFSSCVPLLSLFRKSVGPLQTDLSVIMSFNLSRLSSIYKRLIQLDIT